MTWEFETAEGHTIRVALTPDAAAVSTRYVHGAVDGELFDLDTFEESVLPAMLALADEATEAKMTVWGQAAGKDICAKNTITPMAGGWRIESECDFGEAGKNVSTGTITGDFNTKYVLKMSTTTTGAKMLQMNGTQEMEMTGVWQGACPAGMKPGDMTLPGGATININDVAAMGGK